MNIRKIAFFAASAAILISGMSVAASARTVVESSKTQMRSFALVETQPALVEELASLKSRSQSYGGQLAFNPQPDPPGVHDGEE